MATAVKRSPSSSAAAPAKFVFGLCERYGFAARGFRGVIGTNGFQLFQISEEFAVFCNGQKHTDLPALARHDVLFTRLDHNEKHTIGLTPCQWRKISRQQTGRRGRFTTLYVACFCEGKREHDGVETSAPRKFTTCHMAAAEMRNAKGGAPA